MCEPSDFAHVVWIGGSPCAGKSSVAQLLVAQHRLRLYQSDPLESRPATDAQPTKRYLQSLSPDDLWLRPVPVQTATELDYCREEFAQVVSDLRLLPRSDTVLAEGTALLPQAVVPLLTRPNQAVWMVPTPEFQRHHYPRRGNWPHEVVAGTSDPAQGFANWMERDVRYARIVAAMARDLDQLVIEVDGRRSVAELAAVIAQHLGLGPPSS